MEMAGFPGDQMIARGDSGPVSDAGGFGNKASRLALFLLFLTLMLSYVDRQILGILIVPIKKELSFTDTELGLIGGIAFSLFFAIAGMPLAWLADRKNRVKIIAACCALWSVFTAGCGLAHNFWHLFVARMGVGIGEAGFVPTSFSLLSDLFPTRQRARAIALVQFGIPIGSSLGIFFGGWIATSMDWRAAFLIVGLCGLPLSVILWFAIREPIRGAQEGITVTEHPPLSAVFRHLGKTPSFWLMSFGHSCSSILLFGIMFWLPSMLQRSYGLPLVDVSMYIGGIVLIGGLIGLWTGAWFADRFGSVNPVYYARLPALTYLLAAPAYVIAIFAPNLFWAFPLFVLPQILGLFGGPPINSALQSIVPVHMRASASAIYQFIATIVGGGIGPLIIGALSDHLAKQYGAESLKYGILFGLVFYVVSSILLFTASLYIRRDWITRQEPSAA
jgi:MFS family permease